MMSDRDKRNEEDKLKIDLAIRHRELSHAIQSGVKWEMENGDGAPTSPKHLRTGINIEMCDHAALAELLMRKGVITEIEYLEAVVDGLEKEVARYEQRISDATGLRTHLA